MLTKKQKDTIEIYNKAAGEWNTKRSIPEYVEKFKGYLSGGKILDIGCGTGRFTSHFLNSSYRYFGIDPASEMIKLARKNHPEVGEDFIHSDIESVKFPINFFNGFWALGSLQHIPKNKISGVLKKLKKLVKHNGIGFIVIKEGQGEQMLGPKKNFLWSLYSHKEFKQKLEEHGFEVLHSYEKENNEVQGAGNKWLVYYVKNLKK